MKTSVLALALAFVPSLSIQDPANQRLVLQEPGMAEVEVRADLSYFTRDDSELLFDLYLPASREGAGPLPAVLFMNGSGPVLKDWAQYEDWARLCAAHGLAGVTFQARRGRAEDFDDLLVTLRERAEELGIDPERLGLWACSANARVATPWAMDPERGHVRCAVFYYGLMSFETVRRDLPVLVVRAGQDDAAINDSIDRFAAAALKANTPFRLVNHARGSHGFDVREPDEAARRIVRETIAFLSAELLGE